MFNFTKSIESLIKKEGSILVIDLSTGLKLLNIELKGVPKILTLKTPALNSSSSPEDIVVAIKAFIAENNIQQIKAILNPSLNSLVIKRFQLPAMPYSELSNAIKWQLKDELGAEYSDATLDYYIIKETIKADQSKILDINCAAAKYEEVKGLVQLIKEAGLECVSVVPSVFGYAKIVAKFYNQNEVEPVTLIHFDETASFIAIFKNARLEYYRDIPVTISKLRNSLGGALATNKGIINLSDEDIGNILFVQGIVLNQNLLYKDRISTNEILGMLRSPFERFVQEIKRSLAYYNSQFQGDEISRILISGLGAKIPKIEQFISEESGLDIKRLVLDYPDEHVCDIGLALDYEHNINLLPREFRTEKFEKFQKLSLRWVGFIAFLLLIVFYIFAWAGVGLYQKRLNNSSLQLNVLSEIRDIKLQQETLANLIKQVRAKEFPLPEYLKKLSAICGSNVFLTDLSLSLDSKTGAINGYIASTTKDPQDTLSRIIHDLEATEYIVDGEIGSISKDSDNLSTRFTITLKLK